MAKINKNDLILAFEAVRPGLGRREVIEQSTSFAFIDNHVCTYNDEIAVRFPLKLNITGAVRADELYKFINKISADEIEITQTENEIQLKAGRSKAGMKMDAEIRLPLDELGEYEGKWTKIPETLIPALKMAFPVSSTDMSKPKLTCININGKYVTASDGFRIMRVDIGMEGRKAFKKAILLPATAVKSLVRYQVAEFTETAGWCHFRAGNGLVFSCRTVAEDFPNVEPFLEVEGIELKLPASTKEALERAGIFSRGDSAIEEEVFVKVSKKKIVFKAEGDFGWCEEELNCAYSGEDIEFTVSPVFLYDILGSLQHCIVGGNSLKFQGENFEHVVCLIN